MKYLKLTLALLSMSTLWAQTKPTKPASLARPKLVVGVVVDQMRYDYWFRYYDKYSEGGFKRLMREGFNCRNHHYHYALTVTAAGHASVYTGSTPAIHGIVGNDWFDKRLGKGMYCVADSTVQPVGTTNAPAGKMSPKNMLVSTITDQLRIGTNYQNKTIGIAIKDRGAILPAGHTANGAYWFDSKTGSWITSTFYMNDLPQWVKDYNAKKRPSALMKQNWNTLLPIEKYTESTADDQPYETKLPGAKKSVFPYDLAGIAGDAFGVLASTPHGNTITKEMALEALKNEQLGKGKSTDFLAVSFSTPDYVGHGFGPNSVEEEDIYLRLDRDLAELLNAFDAQVGKGNYLLFLSADHGVMDVTDLWKKNRLPAGRLNIGQVNTAVKAVLKEKFGDGDFIRASENYQFYLNHDLLKQKNLSVDKIVEAIRPTMLDFDGIAEVLNTHDLSNANINDYLLTLYKNGTHAKRSGDIQIVTEPGWMSSTIAATHGAPYNYDTHIPLLFFGWGIKHGETFSRTAVADTAPTVAALLKLLEPSGNIGHIIEDVMKK
ncbi:MAG TPA: alkaline phosphatase family protein [Runella sp.]|nr:alkaline phosphatase family protein [Runella sp.]